MIDLIIRNAQIALSDGATIDSDIGCDKGVITEIRDTIKSSAAEEIDAAGLLLLPGVIDPQVHFREPGGTNKEDIGSGSRAAVAGGVTSFLEMPNCNPLTIDQDQLDWKIARAQKTSAANFGFFIGATGKNIKEINSVNPACGIKVFMGASTGDLLVDSQEELEAIFSTGERLIAVHAEDETRIKNRTQTILNESDNLDYSLHSTIRDPETALIATQRAVELSIKYGRRLHILHMSTAEEVEFFRKHKPSQITCEVIPNHLFLDTDDYSTHGARVQMNPPIRKPGNSDVLWEGLNEGIIDIIATDHAPHLLADKTLPYPNSPSGMPGVETSLPLMLTAMADGKCDLAQILSWMCSGPAKLYGIKNKGIIDEGYDADLTIVDLDQKRPVLDKNMFTKVGWSAYSGRDLVGWPQYTIVGGKIVFEHGKIRPNIYGKPLAFSN